MDARFTLVGLLALVALAAGTAGGTPMDHGDAGYGSHFCSRCNETAIEEATNATVERTEATVRLDADGTGHWTVRYHLADDPGGPAAGAIRAALERAAGEYDAVPSGGTGAVAAGADAIAIRYTERDFATPTVGGALFVQYADPDDPNAVVPASFAADELTVRGPSGYRPVGPVTGPRPDDGVIVFDRATRDEFDPNEDLLVFAPEPSASVAGPLQYDLVHSTELRDGGLVDYVVQYAILVGLATALVLGPVAAVGRGLVSRRSPDRFGPGGYVAAAAVVLAGLLALTTGAYGWPVIAALGLYATIAAGLVWRRAGSRLARAAPVAVATGLVLSSARMGFGGLQGALFVLAGVAAVELGAAVGDGRRGRAAASAAAVVLGHAVVLAVWGPYPASAVAFVVGSVFATGVATLALAPAVVIGLAHGSLVGRPDGGFAAK